MHKEDTKLSAFTDIMLHGVSWLVTNCGMLADFHPTPHWPGMFCALNLADSDLPRKQRWPHPGGMWRVPILFHHGADQGEHIVHLQPNYPAYIVTLMICLRELGIVTFAVM